MSWFPWHLCGWLIALLGAPLLARALLADRAKGRRRCPKCWYAMDSVPATSPDAAHPSANPTYLCPECGHAVRTEKSLLKTRRRLKLLPLTLVAVLAGYTVWSIPRMQRQGAHGLIPTTYLILAVPYPEVDFFAARTQRYTKLQDTLRARVEDPNGTALPQLYWWHLPLWDWSLEARFARVHAPKVDAASTAILEKLDATQVTFRARAHLSDFAATLSKAISLPVRFGALGDELVDMPTESLSASQALDLLSEGLHGRVTWEIADSAIDIRPTHQAPTVAFCSYDVTTLINRRRRYLSWPKGFEPSTPMKSGTDRWIDDSQQLMNAVISLVSTEDWINNGGLTNYADIVDTRLFVVAQPKTQRRVAQFIAALNRAFTEGFAEVPARIPLFGTPNPDATTFRTSIYKGPGQENSRLATFIESNLSPDSWVSNGGDSAYLLHLGPLLIITATPEIHQQIPAKIAEYQSAPADP